MAPLALTLLLATVPPSVAEGAARAVAVEAAKDVRFDVVSQLDVAATADFAADQELVGASGPSATSELAAAYDAQFVITVNLYMVADETHAALALRDTSTNLVVARADAAGVEARALLESVREHTRALLTRVPLPDGSRARLFVSGGSVDVGRTMLVGKARRPTRIEPRSGLRLVLVPAGTFDFGCVDGDPACLPVEKPAVTTTVPAFWIFQTEVTFAAFERCVSAGRCERKQAAAAAFNHPIANVDAGQAEAFCAFAGGRLPTAVEWEYAAKAGRPNIYPWGGEPPTRKHAIVPEPGICFGLPEPSRQRAAGTHPWGANRWGLLDMAGSVDEWTSTEGTSWGGRETRGGSFRLNTPELLRTTARMWRPVNVGEEDVGFRCVVPLEQEAP